MHKFISGSKCPTKKKIHHETNQLVEKLSEDIFFLVTNIGVPGLMSTCVRICARHSMKNIQ